MSAPVRLSRAASFTNLALLFGAPLLFIAQLPALGGRVPVHFRLDGQPDRWSSPHELWLIGGLMWGLTLLLVGIGWAMSRSRGATADPRARGLLRERSERGLRLMELLSVTQNLGLAGVWLTLGTGAAALAPWGVIAAVAVSLAGAIGGLAWHAPRLRAIGAELSAMGVAPGPSSYRLGGLVYYAPDDPAVWTPKRSGVGYTLNFARPGAWLMLALMLGVPLGSVALAILSQR